MGRYKSGWRLTRRVQEVESEGEKKFNRNNRRFSRISIGGDYKEKGSIMIELVTVKCLE